MNKNEMSDSQKLRFYTICDNFDGTADIYLYPETDTGRRAYAIHGISMFDGIEEDIRMRFQAWIETAQEIRTGGYGK